MTKDDTARGVAGARFKDRQGRPAAVVAGLGLNGLGVVRSLARAGIPVVALDTDMSKPTAATRFGRKIRIRALAGPEFVAILMALRPQFTEKPVLILTEEASVSAISSEREEIMDAYRISLPAHELVETLMDKTLFQAVAEKTGFAVPRSLAIDDASIDTAVTQLRYPCILKPAKKVAAFGQRFAKAYRVENPDEVIGLWREMRSIISTAILQEWIMGNDGDVYFCLQYRNRPDQSTASFVGRKILQWPPLVGGTASCAPAPEYSDTLSSLTDRFFQTVGFQGLCSMEYKRDPRDGEFYMVEPTVGRTDYQEEIATLNGVNIPAMAYWALTGETGSANRPAPPPVGWRDPVGEANAQAATNGQAPADTTLRFRDAYFRPDDPMPHIQRQLARAQARLPRWIRSFGGLG